MELVCKEVRRPFTWYFKELMGTYVRKDDEGQVNATIHGTNLPNPLDIFEQRTRLKKEGLLRLDARVHPDPITCKLWRHWNANFNN